MLKRENYREVYTDTDYINALKSGENRVVTYLFSVELKGMFTHIQYNLFKGRVLYNELISELYIYLSANGWSKLDGFKGKNGCHLKTWISSVAWRFFVREYNRIIKTEGCDIESAVIGNELMPNRCVEISIDVATTFENMENSRYVEAIDLLIVKGYSPEEVATMWNTPVSNVYNIKHRAIKQFIQTYKK